MEHLSLSRPIEASLGPRYRCPVCGQDLWTIQAPWTGWQEWYRTEDGRRHYKHSLEGRVCETCDTQGCHRPATWEIECRGAGVSGRLIYSCDEHCPDPAILSPQDEIRRLVENRKED